MIPINQKVADFTLKAYHNNDFRDISLSDYKGKWVVLAFYPADFTFVCPTELEDLANLYPEFVKEGAEVLSVSTDTHFAHFAWHSTSPSIGKIKYPMLADPTAKLTKYFGVYLEDEGLATRATFIIDPDGIVRTMEIHNNDIGRAASESLRKLQAAKFAREHGEVCPANWEPGKKTLIPGINLVGKI